MGSEEDPRKHGVIWQQRRRYGNYCCCCFQNPNVQFVLLVICFVLVILMESLPPPELFGTVTHDIPTLLSHSTTIRNESLFFPSQCVETAKEFQKSQTQTQHNDQNHPKWVMACHRKWCQNYGHCEPCSGIGDRSRFLLSQVQDAASENYQVLLDYPLPSDTISLLDSVIYQDPMGWLAEIFHFRSYDVSQRQSPTITAAAATTTTTTIRKKNRNQRLYTHFTPKGYPVHIYNPCLFHILFQPTPSLQKDVNYHNQRISSMSSSNNNNNTNSIGIHFRTGDQTAFGLTMANDSRVHSENVWISFQKMLQCAQELAHDLFPDNDQPTTFVLATDHDGLKQRIRSDKSNQNIYMVHEIVPNSYLRGLEGERDAWLELYLLASRQGMVVNRLPSQYHGTAGKTSYFSKLAQRIAFMPQSHVRECSI